VTLKKDITEYIKGCSTCQSRKNQPNKPKPPLFPISSDTYRTPFTSIAMDFIVKLPVSKTYDTILTITDTFSKASILIPCNETIDATGVAQLYANYVLPHYGLPLRIISDRDPCFTSSFFRELCRVTGTIQNLSTAYRPQTDGQSEQTNQRLEQYLRIFTVFEQDNWADLLALAQYALNSWPNTTTKKAPYKLLLGYIPCVHQTARISNNPGLEECLQRLATAREEAAEALHRAADIQMPSRFEPYQTGDKVWLEGHNLTTTHPSAKLAPRCYSPFPIICVISRISYQLQLPSQWKIHNVFHATLLTPYKETPLHGKQYQEPVPEVINGQPEWEVEAVLRVRRRRNQLQYLVRWKGFSEAHDSWEPAKDVHTENLVEEFYKKHPTAIRSIHLQSNIHIRALTMTSTPGSPVPLPIPLADRIRDVPFPLPLAERLDMSIPAPELPSTPSPSEELHYLPLIMSGMVTPTFSEESSYTDQPEQDAAKPEDYMIYNCCLENHVVTVSPSPQSKDEENEKLHELRRYARDFRRQHTTDAERFNWDSDDEDYGLAIGRLVVT
jgi:hypothetical protein